jgi:hypothetical protein
MAKSEYHEASAPRDAEPNQKKAKKLDHLVIKRAASGGHIVDHNYDNSGPGMFYHKPEQHAFSNGAEMIKHVMKHMGVKPEEITAGLQDHDEEMDKEEAGGKPKHEAADKEPKAKKVSKSKAEERGED